jgi:hypothetical protein
MTSGMTELTGELAAVEHVSTTVRCPACVVTLDLDDERPRLGMVRWKVVGDDRLRVGTAVQFDCANGHSSEDDGDLLRAFPRRRF